MLTERLGIARWLPFDNVGRSFALLRERIDSFSIAGGTPELAPSRTNGPRPRAEATALAGVDFGRTATVSLAVLTAIGLFFATATPARPQSLDPSAAIEESIRNDRSFKKATESFRAIEELRRQGGWNDFTTIGLSGFKELIGSGARRPSDDTIAGAIAQLSQVVDAHQDVSAKARALAMRSKLYSLAASFEVRGQPYGQLSYAELSRLADEDMRAVLSLLPKLDPHAVFEVCSRIGEAVALDFVIGGKEREVVDSLVRAPQAGFGRRVALAQTIDRVLVPGERPELLEIAIDAHRQIASIAQRWKTDPARAARMVIGLLDQLRKHEAAGGPEAFVAAQIHFSLLTAADRSLPLARAVEDAEKSGAFPGGLNAEVRALGLALMETADPRFLAAQSMIPDLLLGAFSEGLDAEERAGIATTYLRGFDDPAFITEWHAVALEKLLAAIEPADRDAAVERFIAQAKAKIALEPAAAAVYSELLRKFDDPSASAASMEIRAFAWSIPSAP